MFDKQTNKLEIKTFFKGEFSQWKTTKRNY